jgi:hypothetical protein
MTGPEESAMNEDLLENAVLRKRTLHTVWLVVLTESRSSRRTPRCCRASVWSRR